MNPVEAELLDRGIARLGLDCCPRQKESLHLFLAEIEKWNRTINLVRADGNELVIKHALDSLAGLALIGKLERKNQIADVGSGAGFPGIPLSIFMQDCRFTLIERAKKRAGFLSATSARLGLRNVEILCCDLKETTKIFDVVVFRAFVDLAAREMLDIARITHPDGIIAAYKGKIARIKQELQDAESSRSEISIVPLEVPFLDAERHMVLMRRSQK